MITFIPIIINSSKTLMAGIFFSVQKYNKKKHISNLCLIILEIYSRLEWKCKTDKNKSVTEYQSFLFCLHIEFPHSFKCEFYQRWLRVVLLI